MTRRVAERYRRSAAYVPLLGPAALLIFQDLAKGFLRSLNPGLAVAAFAVSIALLVCADSGRQSMGRTVPG